MDLFSSMYIANWLYEVMEEENAYELVDVKNIDKYPSYEVLSSNKITSVSTSVKSQQVKSELKKPTYSWACYTFALVGFILVGSAAFASLAISLRNSNSYEISFMQDNFSRSLKQLQNYHDELQANYSKSLVEHQHYHDELETNSSKLLIQFQNEFQMNYSSSLMQLQNNFDELQMNYSRSLMQLQNNIDELQYNYSRSLMQLQNDYSRLLTQLQNELQVNNSRSLIQLQNLVDNSFELQTNNSRSLTRLQNLVDHNFELQTNSSRSLDSKINTLHMIGQNPSNPAASCCHVLLLNLSSPSDHYWIRSSNGPAVRVYCDLFNRQYADNCYSNGLIPSNLGLNEDIPASSCNTLPSNSPSGYYWISTQGSPVRVYCNMNATSGNLTQGWMRVAYIDMRNTSHQCPSRLTLFSRSSPPRRVCNITTHGCVSTTFTVHGVEYSHVYGRIIGYQDKVSCAFFRHADPIDSAYVYGVSLTHGQSPRKHIWTFAGASDETARDTYCKCPCTNINASPPPVPNYVGNDYFCDTALSTNYRDVPRAFQPSDPLWDGAGCGSTNACCSFNNPPWFIKDLPTPTTDDVEMRLCSPHISDGTAPIEIIELYIQ